MHEVLVNRLGGLSLLRKSVVRLIDRPDMTLDVYRGRKTTIQQQQQLNSLLRINAREERRREERREEERKEERRREKRREEERERQQERGRLRNSKRDRERGGKKKRKIPAQN